MLEAVETLLDRLNETKLNWQLRWQASNLHKKKTKSLVRRVT
jgi:hypothetical protein